LKLKTFKTKNIYTVELEKLMHKVYSKSSHFGKLNANKFIVAYLIKFIPTIHEENN